MFTRNSCSLPPSPLELAGQKELEEYAAFLMEYSLQLKNIEAALDDTLGDAWDFTLDPIALQVGGAHTKLSSLLFISIFTWSHV